MRLHLTDTLCEYTENHILSFLNEKDKISTWRTSKHYYMIQHLKWLKIKDKFHAYKKKYPTMGKALEDILCNNLPCSDFDTFHSHMRSGLWNLNEALHVSTRLNNMDITKLLLKNGADINSKIHNKNCLWTCCLKHREPRRWSGIKGNDMTKMICYLLDKDIDMYATVSEYPNVENSDSDIFSYMITHLDTSEYCVMVRLLLEKGYDIRKYKGPYVMNHRWRNNRVGPNEKNIIKALIYSFIRHDWTYIECDKLCDKLVNLIDYIQQKYPDHFDVQFHNIDFTKIVHSITIYEARTIFKYIPTSEQAFALFYKKLTAGVLELLFDNKYIITTNALYNVISRQKERKKKALLKVINKYGSFDDRQLFHYHEKIKNKKK